MIDLHSHILHGLDDGAEDLAASLALARAAVADGTRKMVATPHVDNKHEFDLEDIFPRVGELNAALAREEVALAVLPGAEIAIARLAELETGQLERLCLGGGTCLLVESPYSSTAPFLEDALFEAQVRGFMPVLAHPERSPVLQKDVDRARRLVERGILLSVDVGSLAGRFGSTVRSAAVELMREELVHNIASDAHDLTRRPPGFSEAFEDAEDELPGIGAQMGWYVDEAPAAILLGQPLPERPEPLRPRRSRLLRFGRRG